MRFPHLLLALFVAALGTVSCSLNTPSNNTVEPMSGVIPVGGVATNNYSFNKSGEIEVTVDTLTPSPSASLGMALGQVVSGTCQLLGAGYVASVAVNRTIEFGYWNKGDYCIQLYDTGVLTVDTSYTGRFSHP
jgi:hypothetical protein